MQELPKSINLKFSLTQGAIDTGHRKSKCSCPIAIEVAKALSFEYFVEVEHGKTVLYPKSGFGYGPIYKAINPDIIKDFILRFDSDALTEDSIKFIKNQLLELNFLICPR